MQKAEIKIIFYLLQDSANVRQNFRQIAAETSTSIGSVHSTFVDLSERGYIIDDGMTRLLRKRQSLIDRWVMAYNENFKSKLLIGRFKFLTAKAKDQWQDIALPDTFCWSGEPAAALQDGYILPQRWDIYTSDTADALIATARMIPDPQGEIFVYQKFWKKNGILPLIVYADLLATGDDRCREAAERLKSLFLILYGI